MKIQFTKMQGIGNDFVVIDAISQQINLSAADARKIADRHYGVGCDQILLVEKPLGSQADFRYRILNADGSEVGQCGNGVRCFARFVVDKGMTNERKFVVETIAGVMVPQVLESGLVQVDMGVPILAPADIPLLATEQQSLYSFELEGEVYPLGGVSMGNPHGVLIVEDLKAAPVLTLGPKLEAHHAFPENANIGFMQVISRSAVLLRVFERGAGETLACGSGACAAVVSGILQGLLDSTVAVELPGGILNIEWQGGDTPVMMTGPAETVFEGILEL